MKKRLLVILLIMMLSNSVFTVMGIGKNADENDTNNVGYNNLQTHSFSLYSDKTEKMSTMFFNNDDELDQQQTSSCNYGWNILDRHWIAQGFTPTKEILTKIDLWIFKAGNPSMDIDVTVSISDSLEGDYTVSLPKNLYSISSEWVEFDFDDTEINPGEIYYIICKANGGDNSNCYCWTFDIDDPYTRGSAWISKNQGSSWFLAESPTQEQYNTDCCFKTYGKGLNPSKPETPSGPEEGEVNIEYSFSSKTIDPMNKDLTYLWDWGDGNTSGWTNPIPSGNTITESHSWTTKGVYTVKVKAKNTDGAESSWSNPIIIGVPLKKDEEDQSQSENDGYGQGVWSGSQLAQSFIPSVNILTKVMIYLFKDGDPDGLTISLRKDLDKNDITSIYKDASEIEGEKKAKWYEFDFPDIEIIPGETYYIIWEQEGGSKSNLLYWYFGENNKYLSGCAWVNTGSWEKLEISGHLEPDFCFKTYYAKSKNRHSIHQISILGEIEIFNFLLDRIIHRFPFLSEILYL